MRLANRSIAPLHCRRGLGCGSGGDRTSCSSGQARRRQRCRAGDRRHRDSQEGCAFGGCRSAVCFGTRQDRQLPDAGVTDPCARRSTVMLALRLFLPESWTSKRARLERAGVPTEYRMARTKPEMALAEIDRVIAAGVRFGYVLADAGYGISAARELAWAVGIPRHLKVYPADVRMIWPVAGRGRPRKSQNVPAACERQWASLGAGPNRRLPTFWVSIAVGGTMSSAVLRSARKWRCGSSANSLE